MDLQGVNNMENLIVRRMEINDIEPLKKIYSDAFDKKISKTINYTKEDIYVVCQNEEIVGMCMVDYIDDIFISKRTAFVNAVCIAKDYRGKGIATFMLKEVELIAREDGCKEIMLTSSSKRICANNLYQKLKYKVHDTNVFRKKLK